MQLKNDIPKFLRPPMLAAYRWTAPSEPRELVAGGQGRNGTDIVRAIGCEPEDIAPVEEVDHGGAWEPAIIDSWLLLGFVTVAAFAAGVLVMWIVKG